MHLCILLNKKTARLLENNPDSLLVIAHI